MLKKNSHRPRVLIVAAFLVVVAMQPSEFRVERTTTIAASPDAVFAQVNDLHKWDAWSPWAKLDPTAKIGFDGPERGAGRGDELGRQRQGRRRQDDHRREQANDRHCSRSTSPSRSRGTRLGFAFKPDGDKTAVTWAMPAHHNFVEKAFCLVMNGDKMMGDA